MRRMGLCLAILTVLFLIGCKHVTAIDLNHGLPGDTITVTASDDAFDDCDAGVTVVYFVNEDDNDEFEPGVVTECIDSGNVKVEVPDLAGVGDTKEYIVSLKSKPRSDETQIFYADICTSFTSALGEKEQNGKNFLDYYFYEGDNPETRGGIYLDDDDDDEYAFSSERQSLAMYYYASVGDCERYVRTRDFTEKYMLLSNYNVLCWALHPDLTCADGSASIDDLKAVEAMLLAYEKFNNPYDRIFAEKLNTGLLTYSTYTDASDNTFFTDCHDPSADAYLPLCYAYFPGMKDLIALDNTWEEIIDNTEPKVAGGLLEVGLFQYGYNFSTPSEPYYDLYNFAFGETFLRSNQNALTGLNLTDYANQSYAQANLNFWKTEWASYPVLPRIEAWYDADGNTVCTDCADISAHAIIGQLAYYLDDLAFCQTMVSDQAIPYDVIGEDRYGFTFSPGYYNSYGQLHGLIALSLCEPSASAEFELDVLE